MNNHYDLIAIGAGSGGLAVAEAAAQSGKQVAIIEASKIGGTCVNNGCVPKKIMWYAANLAHSVDQANAFGIPTKRTPTDLSKLVSGRNDYIRNINRYWEGYLNSIGIHHINGYAHFVDRHTLSVNNQLYTAKHIVIATGGKSIVPSIPGAEYGITSDDFFELTSLPKKVAVIGGGYIGVELSGVLNALGSDVSLIALEPRLLESFDPMLGTALMHAYQSQGIQLHMNFQVNELLKHDVGKIDIKSVTNDILSGFDIVIWAVGRKPNTETLALDRAGVSTTPNGIISVDDYQNTNIPGIYAIGDVTGKSPLTPVAIQAGRKLASRLFNGLHNSKVDYANVPSVVFSHPPVATLGLTESQARDRYNGEIHVYKSEFVPMQYALGSDRTKTSIKLICAGDNQLVVGIHLFGDQVDEILQGFAVALNMGATKADFDNTIAIHPSSAEELVTLKTSEADNEALQPPALRKVS